MSHHNEEQVDKAFAYAPKLLRKLTDAGLYLPCFRLYEDASGILILGRSEDVKDAHVELATELIHSQRYAFRNDYLEINFCCGLVVAAEAE